MTTPDKPFKNYSDQASLLATHNINVNDDAKSLNFAISELKEYGYYSLVNTYQQKLANPQTEKYEPAIDFPFIVVLKQIDEQLSGMILPALLHYENTFASSLSFHISDHFGVWNSYTDGDPGYLANIHYQSNNMRPAPTLRRLRALATGLNADGTNLRERATPALLHYRQDHNHVPAWILINDTTLSELTNWYLISPESIKDEVLGDILLSNRINIQQRKNLFADSLQIVRSYRNTIAHGTSIIKAPRPASPQRVPRALTPPIINYFNNQGIINANDLNNHVGQNDIYSLLLILASQTTGYGGFVTLLEQLQGLLNNSFQSKAITDRVFGEVFGFPKNINERLSNLLNFYKNK